MDQSIIGLVILIASVVFLIVLFVWFFAFKTWGPLKAYFDLSGGRLLLGHELSPVSNLSSVDIEACCQAVVQACRNNTFNMKLSNDWQHISQVLSQVQVGILENYFFVYTGALSTYATAATVLVKNHYFSPQVPFPVINWKQTRDFSRNDMCSLVIHELLHGVSWIEYRDLDLNHKMLGRDAIELSAIHIIQGLK